MSRATTLRIDLSALSHNYSILRQMDKKKKYMAVVKANAYGHGLVRVARHLDDMVDGFAVAITEEAETLRKAGITSPILVLEGPHDESELELMTKLKVWPTLNDSRQAPWFANFASDLPSVWLKVNSGMNRLGIEIHDIEWITINLKSYGVRELTLMSHLAAAEYPESNLTKSQGEVWQKITDRWIGSCSLHNSAAVRTAFSPYSDWARVGYALYGGQIDGLPTDGNLLPSMLLETSVLAVRKISQGQSVGYGARWIAPRDSVIATLPIGYGDGYPWSATDGTPVQVNGKMGLLVGQVSMDMTTVDVTGCGEITPGMPAVLWGKAPTIDQVAKYCGTIGYELMTRITERVPKQYQLDTQSEC